MDVGDIILHEEGGTLYEVVEVLPATGAVPERVRFKEFAAMDEKVSNPQPSSFFHRTDVCVVPTGPAPAGHVGYWPSHRIALRRKRILTA